MSPALLTPAQSEKEAYKMSIAQLEQFVSFIVKRSCSNGANPDHVASKPKWWPRDLAFSYPISRAASMDVTKWRETLLDVVGRCYTYRSRDNFRPRNNGSANRVNKPSGKRTPEADVCDTRAKVKSESFNDVQCGLSPVVTLCDVLQLNPTNNNEDDKIKQTSSKKDFLNYFKLSDTQHCTVILKNTTYKAPSHPIHLLNSQNVPFSSNLGRKMTKDCHIVPIETHQRKIERVERYLTTVINTDTTKPVEYEISFNKTPNYNHTYVFPSKAYRRKERISSKATFLLMNYCKPCTVKLDRLHLPEHKVQSNSKEIAKNNSAKNPSLQAILSSLEHKENAPEKQLFGGSHPVEIKTENPKENLKLSIRNNKNLILKTLVPKNENAINLEKIKEEPVLNPSVLVSPLNLFNIENKKSKTVRKPKKLTRVEKRRVLIYHPRRFSLRVFRLNHK